MTGWWIGSGGYVLWPLRKIYAGIVVDRVCRVAGGLIDDEQGSFRAETVCVDKIFN